MSAAHGIPGDRFVAYFAFAQKLGRYARNHSGETLRMAASDLVDLYEAKNLDRDTLAETARVRSTSAASPDRRAAHSAGSWTLVSRALRAPARPVCCLLNADYYPLAPVRLPPHLTSWAAPRAEQRLTLRRKGIA